MSAKPIARILVVDDEATQMKALCDTLRDNHYETVGVTDGRSAIQALKESRFDLLLTDLTMPEVDGIAVLREARETDPNLPGIIMTGQGTIASAVEAMKTGAFDYILKPFKLSIVLPVLCRALAMRQLRIEKEELEQDLRERTAQLETANHELEAFSYSVSHDLRAPVRAMSGFSRMVSQEYASLLPEEGKRHLARIQSSAARMGELIDALLAFSSLSRQPLAKRTVLPTLIVRRVLEGLQVEHAGRRMEISVADLPDCQADPMLLQQVFTNLLSNAVKYTRERDPAVIEVGFRADGGQPIYFVKDNGAGFDMKYASKLFGVFQRMHRADQFEGTGVGLAIVQRIVRRHGGRVWAEAVPDQGATFNFTLEGAI